MADSTKNTGEEQVRVVRLHHLRPAAGAKTAKTRVGRGEGSKGKTAGRGTKGTKARYQVPAGFEGGQMPIHMRLPKLRGFKNPLSRISLHAMRCATVGQLRCWAPASSLLSSRLRSTLGRLLQKQRLLLLADPSRPADQ